MRAGFQPAHDGFPFVTGLSVYPSESLVNSRSAFAVFRLSADSNGFVRVTVHAAEPKPQAASRLITMKRLKLLLFLSATYKRLRPTKDLMLCEKFSLLGNQGLSLVSFSRLLLAKVALVRLLQLPAARIEVFASSRTLWHIQFSKNEISLV